uniref:Uncharacterized protein n=1 Tax=Sipha flava TaxID=143950 RepID=A0A2S2QP71_9HEMI
MAGRRGPQQQHGRIENRIVRSPWPPGPGCPAALAAAARQGPEEASRRRRDEKYAGPMRRYRRSVCVPNPTLAPILEIAVDVRHQRRNDEPGGIPVNNDGDDDDEDCDDNNDDRTEPSWSNCSTV